MKEFTSAVEDIVAEDKREEEVNAVIDASRRARESAIARLVADGKTQEEAEAEAPRVKTQTEAEEEVDYGVPVEFKLDGRVLHAFPPNDGQLAFMLASMGRGQTQDQRFASIINVLFSCLRSTDQDWFESRLLEKDPKKRLGVKTIEEVFEYCVSEWFARPTQ